MYIQPDVLGRREKRLARVQSHPHTDLDVVSPRGLPECLLSGDGRSDSVGRRRECNEERISLGVNLVPIEPLDDLAQKPPMHVQGDRVALGTDPTQQTVSSPRCR